MPGPRATQGVGSEVDEIDTLSHLLAEMHQQEPAHQSAWPPEGSTVLLFQENHDVEAIKSFYYSQTLMQKPKRRAKWTTFTFQVVTILGENHAAGAVGCAH